MPVRRFKLMADYECWPVWDMSDGGYLNTDPRELGLDTGLTERLEAWAELYDKQLNHEDPAASGFATDDARRAFDEAGVLLWWQFQLALPDAEIFYFSEVFQRQYRPVITSESPDQINTQSEKNHTQNPHR